MPPEPNGYRGSGGRGRDCTYGLHLPRIEVSDRVEERLAGGAQTAGVVRVGDTVRYPAHPRSEFVDGLLRHLERVGFDGAPRALGYDVQGRQVLTFVEGEVFQAPRCFVWAA